MYRPGRGSWFITALVQMWALIALLWHPPAAPVSAGWKIFLRVAAGTIALISIAAGALFAFMTFESSDPWAQWMTAVFTFGLFGLPTSMVGMVAGAIVLKGASEDVAHVLCAIFLAISYFAQWLLLSAALLRRSRF
ncbi:MAG: hypothetical protein QOE14_189 [Humisphaera sp.]|nr:hypothetical protein [Humisphaera sp.]